MESFSTRGVPAARRLAFWNEIASDTFAAMEVRPHDARSFYGRLDRERVGPLTVMSVYSSAVRIRHTREHIARMQGSSYLLLAPLQRQMELTSERSNPIQVHAGELCLIDHARPYELTHGDQVRTLCVDIPRERLEACLPGAQRQIGRLVRAESASARMLLSVLRALADEFSNANPVHLSPASGESVLGFIASAFADDDTRVSGRGMASRAGAFRVYVQARLRDPNLKPAEVAAYVGVSERYLRAVLATQGETFSSYLLRERLELCARLLSDASQRHRTITDIAFQSGFSNTSYFGQAFKDRFGLTPRDYRKQN